MIRCDSLLSHEESNLPNFSEVENCDRLSRDLPFTNNLWWTQKYVKQMYVIDTLGRQQHVLIKCPFKEQITFWINIFNVNNIYTTI